MNEQILKRILDGSVVLFLGAGASYGSKNRVGSNPPLGKELAGLIAEKAGWNYQNEPLGTVYSAAKGMIGDELDKLLENLYKNCEPSNEYILLARFPWARVYTVNIDDAFERALERNSKQQINIKNRFDRVDDKDQLMKRMEYIYLNGSVRSPYDGYIFSAEEYGKANATSPLWYDEVATDFMQLSFIFIGTSLDEPALYHHIERYKERTRGRAPKSYVITPSATPIEIASLESYGLKHISGTIQDFCSWLQEVVPNPPEPIDLAKEKYPELKSFLDGNKGNAADVAELLKDVVFISVDNLKNSAKLANPGTIRDFYKGFKPSWNDVLDDIPARLDGYNSFYDSLKSKDHKIYCLVGPAGSGKSTALKMAALDLSKSGERVYYIPAEADGVYKILKELERLNKSKFFAFIERADAAREDLFDHQKNIANSIIVTAEGRNIWHNRIESRMREGDVCVCYLDNISQNDVDIILDKIKMFGPWTRLSNMSLRERKREIFERSRHQLLIGLMEATTGLGFEQIIKKEYETIASDEDRFFFISCCISSMHRCALSDSVAARALNQQGYSVAPSYIASKLKGIVDHKNGSYSVRHPLYARKIIESVIDKNLIAGAIGSILSAFRVYRHPVVTSLSKNDSDLFKAVINHRFLVSVLRSDEDAISYIYESQEKYFESDGLFWLQYGLFKRDFSRNIEALDILQTAFNAYPHNHTTHALAQQRLILAASDIVTGEQARNYLSEAVVALEKLDEVLDSDDTYPLVTLAEGHISAMISFGELSLARIKAKEYLDKMERKFRNCDNQRLRDCKAKLIKMSTTGVWSEHI